MKALLLALLLSAVFLLGCAEQQQAGGEPAGEEIGLQGTCSGEAECNEFCKNNLGRCKQYCASNPENALCQKPFAFEETSQAIAGETSPAASATEAIVVVIPSPPPALASPAPESTPVLKHVGVEFAPWDKATGRAGAFVFSQATQSREKLFLEFGARVRDSTGGTKILPTFEYVTAPDADVFAVVDGVVEKAVFQPGTDDHEIIIIPSGASEWRVYNDHVRELKVAAGSAVKAGQVIGKTGTGSGGMGKTEIMMGRPTRTGFPAGFCPFKYFDPTLRKEFQEKISRHMREWEEFKANQNIFDEQSHAYPGCAYEALLEKDGAIIPVNPDTFEPVPASSSPSTPTATPTPMASPTQAPAPQQLRGASACQGSGPVRLTSPVIRVEEIRTITPLGQMGGGHVTPTDHQYWGTPDWHAGPWHDILSPAKGVITEIQRAQRPLNNFPNSSIADDFRIVIHHTCTFYSIFIHPKKLSPRIEQLAEFRPDGNAYVSIPVEAGEVIGYATATDFGLYNTETRLAGFLTPGLYSAESWKIHTVDPFDYYDEPLRSQLLAKNLRSALPVGGKIDFDVDGKLVGNWFRHGTSYSGTGPYTTSGNYWVGHAAFAYNHFDPTALWFSFGDYGGESKQFGVKNNSPNPATVGVESGLVKYELAYLEYFLPDNSYWNRFSFARGLQAKPDAIVQGVALVQLLEPRKLKLELFPGKKGEEVSGFTDAAKIYER